VTVGLGLAATSPPLAAQTAAVAVDRENFRAEPGGEIIARLFRDTRLVPGAVRDRWREATLEAWIWRRSVGPYGRDVTVNAGGENLRASPNGERVGRAEGGMRLEPVERDGDWLRVRRTAWIWEPSIEILDNGGTPEARGPEAGVEARVPDGATRETSSGTGRDPEHRDGVGYEMVASGGVLLDRPGGDSLARLQQGTGVEVLDRRGDWARVRVEGWTRTADFATDTASAPLVGIGRDSLQAHPERFRGRLVEWAVQFIALQQAESFRTDFVDREPFILARGPGDDAGFVYIAVPPDRLEDVRSLAPLQQIRILGRVRSPRSALTGAPILELRRILR
jgi:hypothetical protein